MKKVIDKKGVAAKPPVKLAKSPKQGKKLPIWLVAGIALGLAYCLITMSIGAKNWTRQYNQINRGRLYWLQFVPKTLLQGDDLQVNIHIQNSTGSFFGGEDILVGISKSAGINFFPTSPTEITEQRLHTDEFGNASFRYSTKDLEGSYGLDVSPAYYIDDPARGNAEKTPPKSTDPNFATGPTVFFRVYPRWLRFFRW